MPRRTRRTVTARRPPPTPRVTPKPPTPTIQERDRRGQRRAAPVEVPITTPVSHEDWRLQQAQEGYDTHEAWRLEQLRGQTTPTTYPGIPGGPGLSLPISPIMTPLLQQLYQQQVSPYGTVAGPGITTRGPTGGIGGEQYYQPYTFGPSGIVDRKSGRVGAQVLAIARGRERRAAERPELRVPTYGGGGYGYTPRRYSTGRSVGGGAVRGQAAARGMGLVNWRIGL